MKEDQIDIRYGYLLPWPFRLLAALILIIGVALAVEKTVVAILLICASGFILTGYEGTIINKTSC